MGFLEAAYPLPYARRGFLLGYLQGSRGMPPSQHSGSYLFPTCRPMYGSFLTLYLPELSFHDSIWNADLHFCNLYFFVTNSYLCITGHEWNRDLPHQVAIRLLIIILSFTVILSLHIRHRIDFGVSVAYR